VLIRFTGAPQGPHHQGSSRIATVGYAHTELTNIRLSLEHHRRPRCSERVQWKRKGDLGDSTFTTPSTYQKAVAIKPVA